MPSMREKKRYIVFEIENKASKKLVFDIVNKALNEFLGILGMSKVNPVIMEDKFNGKKGIIRINHKYKDEVIVALGLIKELKIKVIGVSGILKKAEQNFMIEEE